MRTTDREITLDREQATAADLRLAYVQHPFPAQGATTDTTHLIAGEHATRDGTYVAITRAREETHIYTGAEHLTGDAACDQLANPAGYLSRHEPDIASINLPLAPRAGERFTQRWERRFESVQPERRSRESERDDFGWEL